MKDSQITGNFLRNKFFNPAVRGKTDPAIALATMMGVTSFAKSADALNLPHAPLGLIPTGKWSQVQKAAESYVPKGIVPEAPKVAPKLPSNIPKYVPPEITQKSPKVLPKSAELPFNVPKSLKPTGKNDLTWRAESPVDDIIALAKANETPNHPAIVILGTNHADPTYRRVVADAAKRLKQEANVCQVFDENFSVQNKRLPEYMRTGNPTTLKEIGKKMEASLEDELYINSNGQRVNGKPAATAQENMLQSLRKAGINIHGLTNNDFILEKTLPQTLQELGMKPSSINVKDLTTDVKALLRPSTAVLKHYALNGYVADVNPYWLEFIKKNEKLGCNQLVIVGQDHVDQSGVGLGFQKPGIVFQTIDNYNQLPKPLFREANYLTQRNDALTTGRVETIYVPPPEQQKATEISPS